MTDKDEIARLKREVTDLQSKLADEQAKCRDDDVAEANRQIRALEKQLKAERDKPPKVQTKTVTQRDPNDEAKINAQRKRILDLEKQLREAQAVHTDRDVARFKDKLEKSDQARQSEQSQRERAEREVEWLKNRLASAEQQPAQPEQPDQSERVKRLERVVRKLRSRKRVEQSDRDQLLATIARLKAEVVALQQRLPEPEPDVSDEIRRYKHQMGVR